MFADSLRAALTVEELQARIERLGSCETARPQRSALDMVYQKVAL